MNAYNELCDKYAYNINVINQKITQPSDDNFSDDELAFLPYFTYIWAQQPEMQQEFQLSIERAWRIRKAGKSSLWNMIYGSTGVQDFQLQDAIETLQQWPLEQINWPVKNSERKDVRLNPDLDRSHSNQSVNLLHYDEILMGRWNGNMFELDGGDGHGEVDPSAWLLPYWLGRYYEYIV